MMKANAVVFTKPNTVEFCQVTCPDPIPGDTVIRVTHSWISAGTEGSYLRGERIAGDTPYQQGDLTPFPLLPGYQKVGIVESVGEQIHDLSPEEVVFCACGRVEGMFCPVGGHISPSVSPGDQIWKLPPNCDPLAFSGLVLTQVGYNCGSRAPVEAGQYAVVVGDGLVGQWAAQTLAWRRAQVIMVGIDNYRLELAESISKCRGINMKTTDWSATIRDLAPEGVSVVVDAVGSREMMEKIVELMTRGGHIVSAGFYGTDDKFSVQRMRDRELSLDMVSGLTRPRMDETLKLIASGALQTLPLITHHFPVAKVAEAWRLINTRYEPFLGVILDW